MSVTCYSTHSPPPHARLSKKAIKESNGKEEGHTMFVAGLMFDQFLVLVRRRPMAKVNDL